MKVTFEGSPADVIRHIKEFLREFEPPRPPRVADSLKQFQFSPPPNPPPAPVPEPTGRVIEDPPKSSPTPVVEDPPIKNEPPQKSEQHVCHFCGKYTHASSKRVANHQKHCKSNPNRVPHPKEGKPLPHGFGPRKKRQADQSQNLGSEASTLSQEKKTDSSANEKQNPTESDEREIATYPTDGTTPTSTEPIPQPGELQFLIRDQEMDADADAESRGSQESLDTDDDDDGFKKLWDDMD